MRIAAVLVLAACRADVGELDGAFYNGDGRAVHCAVNLDSAAGNTLASIDTALDRAAERSEIVEFYAHRPGATVAHATIEHVLNGARERGLGFVTYADFAANVAGGPGVALSFDDAGIDEWLSARPLFQHYGARVTFFIVRYHTLSELRRDQIRELHADGHDIAAHSVAHLRAPSYVEQHGLAAYLRDEAVPSIEILRDDGYEVTAFAYPFGARTDELDRALLRHVPILRSVVFPLGGVVSSPCPR